MTKWTGRLKRLFDDGEQTEKPSADAAANSAQGELSEGWAYLNRVRDKMDKLVQDFANGRVNRAQFEELYTHYQKERNTVERLITSSPDSDAWRTAVTEGHSINIRRRLAARVQGYAVYVNQDETPLRVYGEFASLHKRWISPLLERVKPETDKLFTVETFDTGGEEAAHLCVVPGQFTTLLVLFTHEPARVQLQSLEDLHCHFEQANSRILARGQSFKDNEALVSSLVFPFAAAFE